MTFLVMGSKPTAPAKSLVDAAAPQLAVLAGLCVARMPEQVARKRLSKKCTVRHLLLGHNARPLILAASLAKIW